MRHFIGMLLGIITALSLASPAVAEDPTTPVGEDPVVIEDGLRVDAESYARDMKVDPDEAARRLELMQALTSEVDRLESLAGESLAGSWFVHEPEFKLVISVVGPREKVSPALRSLDEDPDSGVELRVEARHTRAALNDAHDDVRWGDIFPALDGSYTSEPDGKLVLQVVGLEKDFDSTVGELSSALGPTPSEVRDVPVSVIALGSATELDNRGGRLLRSCTSGSTVKNSSGLKGMATAGHCSLPQPYYWFSGGGPFSTVFRGKGTSGHADLQWLSTTAQGVEALFHTSPTNARPQVGRGVGQVGQYLCHFGRTTGYSCTTVSSITYKPNNTALCGGATSCKSVFSLTQSGCTSAAGDSGGPWFIVYEPHGVHSGRNTSTNQCLFSRVYYLNHQLGVTLLQG